MMRDNIRRNMMTTCYEQCDQYDPEYDSGEADSNSMDAFCDEQCDQYDPEYDSGEADSSLNRMRIAILGPVQLAPKHCDCSRCKWRGDEKPCVQKYVTMHQMTKHYNECLVSKSLDLKAQTLSTIGQMQSDFRAEMKVKDEQVVLLLSQHNAFMSKLPKESKAGKERRLQQKQKDLLEKLSNRTVRKVGFKKRVVKDTAAEVVTARRALRRKESRDIKKKEEVERAANFKAVEASVVETVAQVDASVVETVSQVEASVVETVSQVEASVVETVSQVEANVVETVSQVEATLPSKNSVTQIPIKPYTCAPIKTLPSLDQDNDMCRSVGTHEPCRHGNNFRFSHDSLASQEEIFIRVPKDLALQAMEVAMKLGKTNIRIEIV